MSRDTMRDADDLMRFLDASPTAWHAATWLSERLTEEGFALLDEGEEWNLEPGGRYLVGRNGSAVAAIVVGEVPEPESGLRIVGAHTDSPGPKLKPNAARTVGGYHTLGVEVYGGPILATWTDRDLRIAGRVAVSDGDGVAMKLVHPEEPIVTIPNLAIHLNRKVNDEGLKVNAQDHWPAVLAVAGEDEKAGDVLLDLLADVAGSRDIVSWDLMLADAQGAARAGLRGELIRCGRLDNLAMCHAGLRALLAGAGDGCPHTRVLMCYDNEEIGSNTPQGAGSPWLSDLVERVVLARDASREAFMRAVARSWLLSADMAHALNPNHEGKHDPEHRPVMGGGPVLKVNASMRYATDAEGWALFEACCKEAGSPVQRYVNRSDLPCGSTIGPISSARLGIRTIDVGNPLWAMHSIRETADLRDHTHMTAAVARFLVRS